MANPGIRTYLTLLAVLGTVVLAACGGAQSRKTHFLERGRQYLAQGRYDKAGVEFRNALQIAPNDPEARFQSGVVAENLAAYQSALGFYQGAVEVAPDYLEARQRLARLLFLGGRFQMALDTVKPGLEKHPDDSELLAIRAAARARMQLDVPAAIADAERAVRLDPHNAEAVEILESIYVREHRDDDARKVLERGVADNPRSIPLKLALADRYNSAELTEPAARLLKEIIALKPDNSGYRIGLAHLYASRDRLDESEKTLREGLAALPRNAAMTQALIEFLRERRGAAAVEQELRRQLAAYPNDDDMRLLLTNVLISDGQTDKGREILQSIVERHSSTSALLRAQCYLAELRLGANDIAGAQGLISEVLAADPRNSEALQLRARIALQQQRAGDAIVDLRAVLKDAPEDTNALRLLARAHVANREPALALDVLERAADAHPTDDALRLDLIALLVRQGKADQAQPLAETLLVRDPRNALFLRAAFQAQLAHKDYAAAGRTAEALAQILPDKPEGYYLAGVAAAASENFDMALSHLEKAQEVAPAAHEPLEAMVRLNARRGRVGAALERLSKFAVAHPKDPLPRVLAGELLLAQNKLDEAAAEFRAAIALEPQELPAYRGLARVQLLQKDTAGAIQTLHAAKSQARVPEFAALDLAGLYQSVGRIDEAINAYEEALRLNPKSELAANNLAMLLVTNRTDSTSLDRALAVTRDFAGSDNPLHVDTLGWVHFRRGDTDGALQLLSRALSLAPDASGIRYHLAMAQLKAGQTASARGNLEQALRPGVNFEGVRDARTALASLQAVPAATLSQRP
jgi:tetratricopeptide (TPR) repeat protein